MFRMDVNMVVIRVLCTFGLLAIAHHSAKLNARVTQGKLTIFNATIAATIGSFESLVS